MYATFKGQSRKKTNQEIDKLLQELHLEDKKHTISKRLSGGMKRKLQLGMALIGDSKLVFLDEPSSGLDTTSRREMWDMLKNYREDRIIILTTHYMEEADNLGDRVGIMSHGKMMCCGSPDWLKREYGEGYNLTIVKNSKEDSPEVEDFITENIDGAQKLSEIGTEMTFLLKKESANQFRSFFDDFDDKLEDLDILSYGLSMTTLEEVFLRVEREGLEEFKMKEKEKSPEKDGNKS